MDVTTFTPKVRTLSAYMNEGTQPEIQAESLSPCVMATAHYYEEPESILDDEQPTEYTVPQPHELFQQWKDKLDAKFHPDPQAPPPPP